MNILTNSRYSSSPNCNLTDLSTDKFKDSSPFPLPTLLRASYLPHPSPRTIQSTLETIRSIAVPWSLWHELPNAEQMARLDEISRFRPDELSPASPRPVRLILLFRPFRSSVRPIRRTYRLYSCDEVASFAATPSHRMFFLPEARIDNWFFNGRSANWTGERRHPDRVNLVSARTTTSSLFENSLFRRHGYVRLCVTRERILQRCEPRAEIFSRYRGAHRFYTAFVIGHQLRARPDKYFLPCFSFVSVFPVRAFPGHNSRSW